MLRKESEAASESNGPVPQQEKFGSGEPTLADVYRIFKEQFDKWDRKLGEMAKCWRRMDQRVASLEHDARQPRLAMVADGQANMKTRERTEGAAQVVQAVHGDSVSPSRVDPGPKTNSTSFDVKAEPLAFPFRDDVLVENGAAAPKSCLPSLEMRSASAAGGLLPTGKTSTATKITLNQPPLRLYLTEETNLRTLTPYVSYDSSFVQKSKLPAAPSCRRIIETKSGENRMFDPGGSQGCLRACPFLGSWRALLCREVHVRAG